MDHQIINTSSNLLTALVALIGVSGFAWRGTRWLNRFLDASEQQIKALEALTRDVKRLSDATDANTHQLELVTDTTNQNTREIGGVKNQLEVINDRVERIENNPLLTNGRVSHA